MKLLYFSASWCGPCRMFGPVMDRLSAEGKINMQKVNIDEEHELVARYGIRSVPTVIKVDEMGEPQDLFVGVRNASQVEEFYNG